MNQNSIDLNPLYHIANAFVQQYKKQLLSDGKKATGNLINNIKSYVTWNGSILSVSFDMPDYWVYVENGRRPGKFPPLDKIKQWIKVKPVLPRAGKNGKIPTENQLAYLIGRKIATKGIKGTHSFAKTMNNFQLTQKLTTELSKLIQKDIFAEYGED